VDNESSANKNNLSRRGFLTLAGATLGGMAAITAGDFLSHAAASSEVTESKQLPVAHCWGMVIDINKCIGCKYCTYACQAVNNLDDDMIYCVVTTETTQNGAKFFLSRPCMHCAEPPCVHVCPVHATYLRPDGIVAMDYGRCFGCRYCQVACPYDARVFNWRKHAGTSPRVPAFGQPEVPRRARGVMEKCTFCQHRIDNGLERGLIPGVDVQATPACVVACPTNARVFGDLNDPENPISILLSESKTYIRLREELSTDPKVFYIPPQEG
jgi:Fe-S-cluster-containing dehydrogenase component